MKTNPGEFSYAFALTFNGILSPREKLYVEQIIGYLSRQAMKMPSGEVPGFDWLWNGQAVVVDLDTTKTYSDDISDGFDIFWEKLPEMLETGSPIRTTNRAGPNTKGTALIPPIGFVKEITDWVADDGTSDELDVWVDYTLEGQGVQIPFKPQSPNDTFGPPPAPKMAKTMTINIPDGCTGVTVTYDFT